TVLTASITAASLTRSPFTNFDCTPRSSRYLVTCLPPPCTTTRACLLATAANCAQRAARGPLSSSSVPPSLTRTLTAGLRFPGSLERGSYSVRPARQPPLPDCRLR